MNSSMVKWIVPFICGILLYDVLVIQSEIFALILCVLCTAFFVASVWLSRKYPKARRAYVLLFFIVAVLFGYSIALFHSPQRSHYHYIANVDKADMYNVIVDDIPTATARSIKVVGKVVGQHTSDGWHKADGKVILYMQKDSTANTLQYGDMLLIRAKIHKPSEPKNPYEFDYNKYLMRKGIYGQAYVASQQYIVVEKTSKKGLMAWAYSLKADMIDIINSSSLSRQEKAIASALLLGWDENIDADTLQKFSNAGISHLLCVSGLHLGIIAMLAGYCLFFLGNTKRHRIIKGCIQLIVLWLFAMITGLAPSATRATIMFSLIVIGEMFFTRANIYSNIATSAFIILLFNPNILYDIGFQLSYFAVVGIVALQPFFFRLISIPKPVNLIMWYHNRNGEPSNGVYHLLSIVQTVYKCILWVITKVWSFACVSLAAQLAVTPFVLYYFHQFPLYFLVANVLIVPFAGILLGTAILIIIFSWLPIVRDIIDYLFSMEIKLIDSITSFTSNLPLASIDNIYFDEVMFTLGLLFVLAFVLFVGRRWKYYFYFSSLSLTVLILYKAFVVIEASSQSKWIVYNSTKGFAMEMIDGRTSCLLTDSIMHADYGRIEYISDNYRIRSCVDDTHNLLLTDSINQGAFYKKNYFVAFGTDRIGIVSKDNCKWRSQYKLRLTHLILTGNPNVSVAELKERFDFDVLIIASNNSQWHIKKWEEECNTFDIPYHNISRQGAYTSDDKAKLPNGKF